MLHGGAREVRHGVPTTSIQQQYCSDNMQLNITLADNGDAPFAGGLKVPHGSAISFIVPLGAVVGSMLFELYTNHPTNLATPFERSKFHVVQRYFHPTSQPL